MYPGKVLKSRPTPCDHAQCSEAVQVLDLGRANLTWLDEDAFLGLENLRLLSLTQNYLTQLPEELLKPLPKLEELFFGGKTNNYGEIIVTGNLLRTVPEQIFFHTKQLKTLEISENKLEQLPAHAFQSLTSLQTLDLESNKISQISGETFAGLTSLQTLNLESNKISQISGEAFAGLTSLQTLDLYGNKISQISGEAFAGLTSLQTLDLRYNDISQLSDDLFAGLVALRVLDLRGNPLLHVPAVCHEDHVQCELPSS